MTSNLLGRSNPISVITVVMENSQSEPVLKAEKLIRSFTIGKRKIEVLRGIDLEVTDGECLFLCGASGAGKSTLLYTLAGMEKPEAGKVIVAGQSIYNLSDQRRAKLRNETMGFVFQGYFLLPELTALENVLLPAMIHNDDRQGAAEDALERVGLAERMHHLPAELSGGEQQRVAIARALTNNPRILFADEPTGNLDSKTGSAVFDLLLEVARDSGRTMILVTHDSQLASRGDRMVMIVDGMLAD